MVKQERAARTRAALIRSAAEVFDREGCAAASLTRISAGAGVSNGALHFHFAGRTVLVDAVEEAALERLRVLTGMPRPLGTGQVQLLVDVTHALADALRGDVVLRVGFALGGAAGRRDRSTLRRFWRCWVEEAVRQAAAEGELRPELAQDAVTAVVAATVGFEVLGGSDGWWLSESTVTRFWRLLLPTLGPASRSAHVDPAGTGPH